jgi:hypothetical protein
MNTAVNIRVSGKIWGMSYPDEQMGINKFETLVGSNGSEEHATSTFCL